MPSNYTNLNGKYPISLKYIEDIIERIHKRAPQLTKSQIAIIVKAFFNIIRYSLVVGKGISISGLFNHLHLIRFKRENYYVIKTKFKTPRCFKCF